MKPNVDAIAVNVYSVHKELDDPRLLGGKQFLPHRVQSLKRVDDVAFGNGN